MKAKEYRQLTEEKLIEEKKKLEFELMKAHAKFGQAKKKDKDNIQKSGGTDMCKRLRREIARINTILTEKKHENT